MQVLNPNGVSNVWVEMVKADLHKKHGKYSITELIGPPQIKILTRRHWDEVTTTVEKEMWRVFGQAVHSLMALHSKKGVIVERYINYPVEGILVGGTPDRVEPLEANNLVMSIDKVHEMFPDFIGDPEGTQYNVVDFKITQCPAIYDGAKLEWIAQINLYAFILRQQGLLATCGNVETFLYDWNIREKKKSAETRKIPSPLQTLIVPTWTDQQCYEYLHERTMLHEENQSKEDHELTPCSNEERWMSGECFAVEIAKGARKGHAIRGGKCSTKAEAQQVLESYKGKHEVTLNYRRGEYKRCQEYCYAAPFCHQWAADRGESLPINGPDIEEF